MLPRLSGLFFGLISTAASALPDGFVYLHDVAPNIIEDMRYASPNNFTGRPVSGYNSDRCILSNRAASQLAIAERYAEKLGMRLKVYDCYRPQAAVNEFYAWSLSTDNSLKYEFYPRQPKNRLFSHGYISKTSGHTRGSTVDLTLVNINRQTPLSRVPLTRCYSQSNQHSNDNSINMGTRFDCFDKSANVFYQGLNKKQLDNRLLLRSLMMRSGFYPNNQEWWHFTVKNEPFPRTYFNFPVQ